MVPRLALISLLLSFVACSEPHEEPKPTNPEAEHLRVYQGATLIDRSGEAPLRDSTIVVRDNRIVAVGSIDEVEIPTGAAIISAEGRWIIPGMIESHAHFYKNARPFWLTPQLRSKLTPDQVRREEALVVDRLEYTLSRYLCAGVTGAVSITGPSLEFKARELSQNDNVLAPRVFVSGPALSNLKPFEMFNGEPTTAFADSPKSARAYIRKLSDDGVDVIKLAYEYLPRGAMALALSERDGFAMLEAAADEASKLGLDFPRFRGRLWASRF